MYVYIMTNKRNGTLYTGVTNDLVRRAWEHRNGVFPGFTKRYKLHMLVWYECHDGQEQAIHRENRLKEWQRKWKLDLIEAMNPEWRDLYPDICEP